LSSDAFRRAPRLEIDVLREQAKAYGVSEARILALLRNAYSQSYLYLIKQPTDQYQVILEVQDTERASADDLGLLYIKSDDGKRMVPLRSLVHWRTTLGPQAVNHLNQFTSVTTFFNLKPGVALGHALRVRRHVHADGHREEERHHDRGLRAATDRARGDGRGCDSRGEPGSVPADHHDHGGRGYRRVAHRARLRSRRRFAARTRPRSGRRAGGVAVHHPLRDSSHLSVPGGAPGEGARPRALLPAPS